MIVDRPPAPDHSKPIDRRILIKQLGPNQWEVRPLTVNERAEYAPRLSAATRCQRDKYLSDSDRYVLPDRWASYTDSERKTWTDFRQQLRDLPTLVGFPYDITWPTHPRGTYE
jgi:hypothetical protein